MARPRLLGQAPQGRGTSNGAAHYGRYDDGPTYTWRKSSRATSRALPLITAVVMKGNPLHPTTDSKTHVGGAVWQKKNVRETARGAGQEPINIHPSSMPVWDSGGWFIGRRHES